MTATETAPVTTDTWTQQLRGMVTKLQGKGSAEAERLRSAIRKAIAVLRVAVELCADGTLTGGRRFVGRSDPGASPRASRWLLLGRWCADITAAADRSAAAPRA